MRKQPLSPKWRIILDAAFVTAVVCVYKGSWIALTATLVGILIGMLVIQL